MNPFISYLIVANLSVCFFLLIYQILLSKETDHRFNRAYLLLALLISLMLPFFHFQIPSLLTFEKALPAYWLPEIKITPSSDGTAMPFYSSWFWATVIYVVGAIIIFLVFLIRLLRIIVAVYQSPRIKSGSVWLIELKNKQEVFSFFNFIFIGKLFHLTEIERQQIVRHEQVHINNYHSFDILFVNLIGVLFWFNPFLKTYRKLVIQLHEFEADARSVDSDEVDSYCCLLAKAALASSGYQLANHFTNSLTIKRIEMMKTIKIKIAGWKIVSITAVAFSFCCLIAGNGFVLAQADQKNISPSNKVFDQVDELPTFGNDKELYEFIGKNLRYPQEARDAKIEGKVYVNFVVEKDGTLSDVKALKGIGHGCDEEVVRVMKSLPKWKPGEKDGKIVRTMLTIPIVFQLTEQKKGG